MQIIEMVGRIILGGFFIMSGMNHFTKMSMMVGAAMKNNIPIPKTSVAISGLVMIAGGLGILLWVYPGLASAGLALFLVAASFTMHKFWTLKNAAPETQMSQMRYFMGNMALCGALLILISLNGGLF